MQPKLKLALSDFGHDVVSIQKQFLVSKMIKWGHVGDYKQLTVIDWQKLLVDSN